MKVYFSVSIDQKSPWEYRIIEGSKFNTYIFSLIFVWSLDDEYAIYSITT